MANKGLPKGITRRKDGRFCIRVTRNGQSVCKYAKTRREAEKMLREITYQLEHGIFTADSKLTVGEWFDDFLLVYKEPVVKAVTCKLYRSLYRQHIGPAIGSMRIQAIRASHIQKILNSMAAEGFSAGSIGHVRTLCTDMFKHAVRERLILVNPVEGATTPTGRPEETHKAMSIPEQRTFTEHLQADKNICDAFLLFMLYTGLRIGEASALQWQDVDLKNAVVHVRHTVHVINGKDVLTSAKTATSVRDVPLQPKALEILRGERERARTADKVIALHDERFVFYSGTDRALNYNRVKRHLLRVCKKIRMAGTHDFPSLQSHDLRHTFATRCVEGGMPPQTLQRILGHSNIRQTMDVYYHSTLEERQEAMAMVASFF